MRKPLLSLLLAAFLLTPLAGCGGDDEAAPSSTTRVTVTTTTVPVNTSFTGIGSAEYCALSRAYVEKSKEVRQAPADPATLRGLYRDVDRDIKQAILVAPEEIKPDVQVIADGLGKLIDALEQADYDFSRVRPDAIAGVLNPQFQASQTRVEAYATNVCGLRP